MPKISLYPAMSALTGDERLLGVQGTDTHNVTVQAVADFAAVTAGATDLDVTRTDSAVSVLSSTGSAATIGSATGVQAGVMSATDKVKLDSIPSDALSTTTAPELIRDTVGAALVQGANVTLTVDDAANTITIAATGGGGGGGANLTTTASATTVTVFSDSGTDAVLAAADGTSAGVLTAADKTKLDGIATSATANATNAQLRDRSTHTGTQPQSSIDNLSTDLAAKLGGPASATDNTLPRFDGTTGKLLQGSGIAVSDNDEISGYRASINAQTGTTYTLVTGDCGKIVQLTNAAAITLTLPNSLPAGFCCTVVQGGAGQVTFSAQSGGTLANRQSQTKCAGLNAFCSLYVRSNGGTNAAWILGGDTSA